MKRLLVLWLSGWILIASDGLAQGGGQSIVESIPNPLPFLSDRFGEAVLLENIDGSPGDELIVGAPGKTGAGANKEGYVFVFSPTPAPNGPLTLTHTITAPSPFNIARNRFGTHISVADVTGNGSIDLVVGAPGETPGNQQPDGSAFVFEGQNYGTSIELPQTHNETTNRHGTRVLARDLDSNEVGGDAAAEVIVAAPWKKYTGDECGVTYVYHFNDPVDPLLPGIPSELTCPTAVEGHHHLFLGLGVGDVTGTTKLEVIMGASHWGPNNDQTHKGLVQTFVDLDWNRDSSTVIRFEDPRFNPPFAQKFGDAIATYDFDQDGFDDVAIGGAAPEAAGASNPPNPGSVVHIFHGGPNFPTEAAGPYFLEYRGDLENPPDDNLFGRALAWADTTVEDNIRDLVGDGQRDQIIGGILQTDAGTVEIFRGDLTTGTPFDPTTKITLQNPTPGPNDQFGWAVDAGDRWGIGKEDIAVGAPGWKQGAQTGGKVVIYGR